MRMDIDMAEISWQNVNAPSNEAVFRGMALASAGLDRAAAGFEGAGKTLTDANQANMNQQDDARKLAVKSILANTKSVAEVDAQMGNIQSILGGMNDKGSAATMMGSISGDTAKQFDFRDKGITAGTAAHVGQIGIPEKIQTAENNAALYESIQAPNQNTALLNAGVKSKIGVNDAFNANFYLPQTLQNTDETLRTEQDKKNRAVAAERILVPITQKTQLDQDHLKAVEAQNASNYRVRQSPDYQKQSDIAADILLRGEMNKNVVDFWKTGPQQALAEIGGLEGTMQLGAAKTKADSAEVLNRETIAVNAPVEAALKTHGVLADRASQYAKEQKTLKETRFNQDSMGSVYKNASTPVENIADLSNTFAEAKYQAGKDLKMDLSHISQEAMNEIALRGNLDPNWLMSTSVDSYKEMIKDYVNNRGGADEMDSYLSTEKSYEEKTAAAETAAQFYEINHLPEQFKVKQDVKTDARKEAYRQSILPLVQDAEDPEITGTPYRDAPKDSKPVSETLAPQSPKRVPTPIEIFNEKIRQTVAKR